MEREVIKIRLKSLAKSGGRCESNNRFGQVIANGLRKLSNCFDSIEDVQKVLDSNIHSLEAQLVAGFDKVDVSAWLDSHKQLLSDIGSVEETDGEELESVDDLGEDKGEDKGEELESVADEETEVIEVQEDVSEEETEGEELESVEVVVEDIEVDKEEEKED